MLTQEIPPLPEHTLAHTSLKVIGKQKTCIIIFRIRSGHQWNIMASLNSSTSCLDHPSFTEIYTMRETEYSASQRVRGNRSDLSLNPIKKFGES